MTGLMFITCKNRSKGSTRNQSDGNSKALFDGQMARAVFPGHFSPEGDGGHSCHWNERTNHERTNFPFLGKFAGDLQLLHGEGRQASAAVRFFSWILARVPRKKDRLAGLDKDVLPVVKCLCELDFAKQSLMS